MSAATATRTNRTSKKTYKPHIRIVDRPRGLYTVQSERYTHLLYQVDVTRRTCECEGASKWGITCKHLRAATAWHETIERSRLAAQASPYGKAAGLMEAFGVAS